MCEMNPIDSFVFVIKRDCPISFIRGYLSSNISNKIYSLNIKKKNIILIIHYKAQINPKVNIYKVSEILILGSDTQASWRQIVY